MSIFTQLGKTHNKTLPGMKISRKIQPIIKNEINSRINWHDIKTVNVTIITIFKKIDGRQRMVNSKTDQMKILRKKTIMSEIKK